MLVLIPAADLHAQVIFQRERVTISPPPPKTQESTSEEGDPNTTSPPKKEEEKRPTHDYRVEIRNEEALQLEYIHTLNDLGDEDGVMVVFNLPSIVSIPTMKVYKPVDIVFVTEDGEILQIAPNIVPAEITRDIEAKEPVLAFLYLKAGETKRSDIRPGDIVTHGSFNAKPLIIQ